MTVRPRLLFVVTEDWAFWSHRLPMARAALAAGYDVAVACRVAAHRERIEAEGIRVLPLRRLIRESRNPLAELAAIAELTALYRRERPALVHHVALKPVLYGSVAARLAGVAAVVNAMIGMGYVFTARSTGARLLRPVITQAFRFLLGGRGRRLLVQNEDDRAVFADQGLVAETRITLIPGSGVDVHAYQPYEEAPIGDGSVPVALCVARLLWDKGIGELMDAARKLHGRGIPLRLWVVGDRDPANPRCVPQETIDQWTREGVVEFLGRRDDIADLWTQAHIAVLPSHREGMPKALLEAAASGRPLIATDVPGCRALVRHGHNGLLVPLGDVDALAEALESLAVDPALRRRFGAAARRDVEEIYSDEAVGRGVVALYASVIREVEGVCP